MKVTAKTKICMVIGDPIDHSLSPVMHNAGFASIGINNQFIFIAAKVNIKNIKHIPEIMKILGIRGISLTIPHKIEIIKHLGKNQIDPIAKRIGAVNTLVNDNGRIKGFNTDWTGILKPLEKITNLNDKRIAIIGTGGVARAAAFALSNKKAKLIFFGRNLEKVKKIAKAFGGSAKSLNNLGDLTTVDIIFNATPIGMQNALETPVPKAVLNDRQIIFDAVYKPGGTKLLNDAKEKGTATIDGLELLLHQGLVQFELFTGKKAPVEAMRRSLS